MIRQSKRSQFHALLIAVIVGIGLSVSIIAYYGRNFAVSNVVIKDGLSEILLSIHPETDGLVSISLIHVSVINIGYHSANSPNGYINTDVGDTAALAEGN